MNATHPSLPIPHRRPLPAVWCRGLAAVLLVAGLALHGRDTDLFVALNGALGALPAPLPQWLWSMLSVAGLGLSAFIVLVAAHPGAGPEAMRPVAALLWSFPIGGALTHLFKRLLDHPRPATVLPPDAITVIGEPLLRGAMPSGHAVTALALAGLLLLSRRRSPLQQGLIAAGTLMLLLARVAVGAHWPADVCAGAAIGLMTAAWAWPLSARGGLTRWLGGRRGQLVLALVQIGCGLAIARLSTGYPAALPLQGVLAALSIGAGLHRGGRALAVPARRSAP